MKNDKQYSLVRTRFDEGEWKFRESEESFEVHSLFDSILEEVVDYRKLSSELVKFLKLHPWHFDAMNHYANCKLHQNRPLDAFAFAQTSVTLAKQAFPDDFQEGVHTIPSGYIENRPFHRSLYQLMESFAALGDFQSAAFTASELLAYDIEDRIGARLELPIYLMKLGTYEKVVALFEDTKYEDRFNVMGYLYPVALLHVGRQQEAEEAIDSCLSKPRVAKYLLDPMLSIPQVENPSFGITGGSETEGYIYGNKLREFWMNCDGALKLLLEKSKFAEQKGWPAYLSHNS